MPWRRKQLPTPVLWPGEFHGLYSPWGLKELDTTEQLSLHLGMLSFFGGTDKLCVGAGGGAPPPRPRLTRAQSLQSQSFGSQDEQSRCRQGRTCTRFSRSMNTGPGDVPTTSRLRSCLPRSQKQRHFPQGPRTESSNSRDGEPGRRGTYIPAF